MARSWLGAFPGNLVVRASQHLHPKHRQLHCPITGSSIVRFAQSPHSSPHADVAYDSVAHPLTCPSKVLEPWRLWSYPNHTPPDLAAAIGETELARMWDKAPASPADRGRAYCDMDEALLARNRYPLASCQCFEGRAGAGCEQIVRSVCLNQCSGHGECVRSWCVCNSGWSGSDCSIPTSKPRLTHRRSSAAIVTAGSGDGRIGKPTTSPIERPLRASAYGLRPSVYVYELPAKYNTWTAETRMHAEDCMYKRWADQAQYFTAWERAGARRSARERAHTLSSRLPFISPNKPAQV